MTARLVQIPIAPAADDGLTVAQAARSLGCDPSTVRKMLRRRKLSGWRVGAGDDPRGVRVSAASIEAWKRRRAIGGQLEAQDPAAPPPARRRRSTAVVNEMTAELRALGVSV